MRRSSAFAVLTVGAAEGATNVDCDRAWPLPLELGAEFLHGEASATRALAGASRLLVEELSDRHVFAERGRLRPVRDIWIKFASVCRRIYLPRRLGPAAIG